MLHVFLYSGSFFRAWAPTLLEARKYCDASGIEIINQLLVLANSLDDAAESGNKGSFISCFSFFFN